MFAFSHTIVAVGVTNSSGCARSLSRYNVPERANWDSQRSSGHHNNTNNHNNSSLNSRNRFSRYRNRDRYQERHTVERDRHVEHGERFSNEVMTRNRPGSHRFTRAHSMVPQRNERDSMYMKRPPNASNRYHDNAMTLPASYGRNKFRRNGKLC